jgi:hypothetical protein
MNPLKRINPQLSKLAAQVVYAKHKEQAEREVAELRKNLAALIRRGHTHGELEKALLTSGISSYIKAEPIKGGPPSN